MMFNNLAQFVPSHVCLSCDGCCRFKEENSRWRPKVAADEGLAEHIFAREAMDAGGRIRTTRCKDGSFQCRFFAADGNICTIYAYRPLECRLYPFILRERDKKVFLAAHRNCPYVEETRSKESFDNYVEYLKGFFRQKDVAAFLRKNRNLVDTYADYNDELEELFPVEL